MLAAVNADEALKHIPIVMLTSSREQIDLLKCYDLGVNAYVVKPVEFGEFMDAIQGIGSFWIVMNEARPQISGERLA
jgi:CheY-like chemotaxis protein